jgi:cell wall-associated NlpC family hydrolase
VTVARSAIALSILLAIAAPRAVAQDRGLDVTYGWWRPNSTNSVIASASLFRPLIGPLQYGLGVVQFRDADRSTMRSSTGAEASLALARSGRGPYAVGGVSLSMRHQGGDLDAAWSAGLGYALQPLSFLSLGVEVRYRVEDQAIRGFWQLDPADRRGLGLFGRVAISFGGGGSGARSSSGSTERPRTTAEPAHPFVAPSDEAVSGAARAGGASNEATAVTTKVVRAALDAMGTPYSWGGSDANGFDCSGLIQFAYGTQGLIVPRVSGDQMRTGSAVPHSLDALRPGDLLGFAVEGDRVTHVGLYVGGGEFIHSASGGVKLSSLNAADPDSQWWRRHWLSARRIVQ